MGQAITIFVAGIGGVFTGMALLYFAILIVPKITKLFETPRETE